MFILHRAWLKEIRVIHPNFSVRIKVPQHIIFKNCVRSLSYKEVCTYGPAKLLRLSQNVLV